MNWINYFGIIFTEASEETTANTMSQTTAIVFVVLGILAIILSVSVLFLYFFMRKRQKNKVNDTFQVKPKKARYSIFNFWINYLYFFLIAFGIIAALILLPIGITNLV